MLFKNISVIDENFNVLQNKNVIIKDQIIHFVGDEIPQEMDNYSGEIINGKNKLLMPGFFNLHCHVPMTLMRGYGENLSLNRWLHEKIFPFEEYLNAQHTYNGSMLGIAEMLSFGIVSFSDMYFFSDAVAKACIDSGIKANISRSIVCFDDSDVTDLQSFWEAKILYDEFNGCEDGRIKVEMSIHAEYTSTPKVVSGLADYAKKIGAGMHIHLSETESEHQDCIARHSLTPAGYMNQCGIFDVPTIAAHCVFVDEHDMDLLAEKNVSVSHCPVSNLKLGSGVAPVSKMLEKGINVAIGTDGVASNNNTNFFEELKLAPILQKGYFHDPLLVSTTQTLQMATRNGAKAQGRQESGVLKVGNRADLIMIDLDKPHLTPAHDIISNLIYSAVPSDIVMTIVDGKVLYKNNEYLTIDIEKVKYETKKSTDEILSRINSKI